ncbi:MAG: phosphatase PAP2 family protein [Roseiarcus sp.]
MKLSNSLSCRASAIAALALVALAQFLSAADSDTAPSRLLIRFFCFPAGWSVAIFLLIVVSMRDRAILVGWMLSCASVGGLAGAALGSSRPDLLGGVVGGFGFAPYLFALWRIGANSRAERSQWIDLLAAASLIHISALAIPFFRDQTARWLPAIVDLRIAELDEAFGAQPSSAMANVFAALPPLHSLSLAAYAFVQLPIVVVAAFHWKRKVAGEISILPAFIIGSMIGFACYWLTPAIGPRAYFGADFPLMHTTVDYLANRALLDFNASHPRNAMPSMHISWALLVFLYTRGFPLWARFYAGAFVFLTACATLGLGEHYLMDLVVAAPLVLAVRALCAAGLNWAESARLRGAATGFALLAFWIGAIRLGPSIAPSTALILVALTVGASALLEHALARAENVHMRPKVIPAPESPGVLISLR